MKSGPPFQGFGIHPDPPGGTFLRSTFICEICGQPFPFLCAISP